MLSCDITTAPWNKIVSMSHTLPVDKALGSDQLHTGTRSIVLIISVLYSCDQTPVIAVWRPLTAIKSKGPSGNDARSFQQKGGKGLRERPLWGVYEINQLGLPGWQDGDKKGKKERPLFPLSLLLPVSHTRLPKDQHGLITLSGWMNGRSHRGGLLFTIKSSDNKIHSAGQSAQSSATSHPPFVCFFVFLSCLVFVSLHISTWTIEPLIINTQLYVLLLFMKKQLKILLVLSWD